MAFESKMKISDLPVELLDHLFEYCGDVSSKVHLAQTHPYLGQAFAYHCRNSFERVSFCEDISLSSWRFILPVCGPNIKMVHIFIQYNAEEDSELANLVALHCLKLEKVKINFDMDSVDSVKSLIRHRQSSLRGINLRLMDGSMSFDNKILNELPELPLLEGLTILNIPVYNCDQIHKFENLVQLKIQSWNSNNFYIDIFQLCAPLRKLQELALGGVTIIRSEQTNVQLPLEKLYLWNYRIEMEIPVYFNLKILKIEKLQCHSEVQRFILSQGKTLESLTYWQSASLNKKEFLEVLRKCQNLRFFSLQNVDFPSDLEFVEEIVNILKQNGVTPNNPLVLVLNSFSRYKNLQKWLKITSNPELIMPKIMHENLHIDDHTYYGIEFKE